MNIDEQKQILRNLIDSLTKEKNVAFSQGDAENVSRLERKIFDTENVLKIFELGLSALQN
jgi:hypothetical protein